MNELAERAFKCGYIFDDDELMGMFVEGPNEEIFHSLEHSRFTHRSIQMYTLITFFVSIHTMHADCNHGLGTREYKNQCPFHSARETGHANTAVGYTEALLVSEAEVSYLEVRP